MYASDTFNKILDSCREIRVQGDSTDLHDECTEVYAKASALHDYHAMVNLRENLESLKEWAECEELYDVEMEAGNALDLIEEVIR